MEDSTTSAEEIGVIGHRIIVCAKENPLGLSNEVLTKSIPDITGVQRVNAINKLLQDGILEVLIKNKELLYKLKDQTKKESGLPKGSDNEERIVYSIIEAGGNKGIWVRDIRVKSNLVMTQLNKLLKNLENKKLIKAVRAVNANKKKVYMLYNLEPDRSVTGGAWYNQQDFESEFVHVLNQRSIHHLREARQEAIDLKLGPLLTMKKSCLSVADVLNKIISTGISNVQLDENDLETILNTVVYDGKAERLVQSNGKVLYRAVDLPLSSPGLIQMPCGVCPVIKNCSTCGEVTPQLCTYMNEWLS